MSFSVIFTTNPNSQSLDGKCFLFIAQVLDVVSTVSYSQMQIDSIEKRDLGIWNFFLASVTLLKEDDEHLGIAMLSEDIL